MIPKHPVSEVKWVPIEKVKPNDYNPNSVATPEMKLLHLSMKEDGITQPVVTFYDENIDMYVIVDGFHRYTVIRTYEDIRESTGGTVPIVVIDKTISERRASTVRHNRARGKHAVMGMAQMVFDLLDEGWTEPDICNRLGMEPEEVIRLKHVTGFSKLFENTEYRQAWETRTQIKIRQAYEQRERNSKQS